MLNDLKNVIYGEHMTVDVTETLTQAVHPAFELIRQHHVDALDIFVSEYRHKVTGAVHYHLASPNDENEGANSAIFCVIHCGGTWAIL